MSSTNHTIREALYEAPGPRTKRLVNIITALSVVALLALLGIIIRQFYVTGQLSPRYWSFFGRWTTWRFLAEGIMGTIEVSLMSMLLAFTMGFLMMRGRLSSNRFLRGLSSALIAFSRGVPTLLFIYFFFLVVPQLGIKLAAFWKISIPVALSAAGVTAETLRSGVNAVPKGQTEAALSLGMRPRRAFYRVIFPQAFRYVIPSLIAELVIVLKDTTFAYVVSYPDLMQNAKVLISNYDAMLSVYLVAAVIYILMNYLLNRLSVRLTRRKGKGGAALEPARH